MGGFTSRYGVHKLVWYESTPYLQAAIAREKQIKSWRQWWKIELIERSNPNWRDIYKDLI
jgi:putative endonuclease